MVWTHYDDEPIIGVWIIYCDLGHDGIKEIYEKCFIDKEDAQKREEQLNNQSRSRFSALRWHRDFLENDELDPSSDND